MDDRYVAGLFDGEGYVRIAKWKKPNSRHVRYQVSLGIGMSHRPIIEALHEEYGGSLNQNRHDLRNKKNRIQFTWTISSRGALEFLKRIVPFLVVKKDEANIAMELQAHIDANPYRSVGPVALRDNHEEIIAHREKLYLAITALKKRSYPPLTK